MLREKPVGEYEPRHSHPAHHSAHLLPDHVIGRWFRLNRDGTPSFPRNSGEMDGPCPGSRTRCGTAVQERRGVRRLRRRSWHCRRGAAGPGTSRYRTSCRTSRLPPAPVVRGVPEPIRSVTARAVVSSGPTLEGAAVYSPVGGIAEDHQQPQLGVSVIRRSLRISLRPGWRGAPRGRRRSGSSSFRALPG